MGSNQSIWMAGWAGEIDESARGKPEAENISVLSVSVPK
jgi:hypothetical protein